MRSEQNKSANIEKKNVLTVVAIFQVVQRLDSSPLVLDGGEDAAAADAGVQGVVRLQCATVVIEEVEDMASIIQQPGPYAVARDTGKQEGQLMNWTQ